jgi:hypothetical protein
VSSLPHRGGVCCTKVPIEVVAPLSVALYGDAAVVTRSTVLEFGPQIERELPLVHVLPTVHVVLMVSASVPLTDLAPHRGGSPTALHDVLC